MKLSSKDEREKFINIIQQNHRTYFYLPPHPSIDINLGGVIYFKNIRSDILELFIKKNPTPTLRLRRPFIDRLCSKITYFFNRIPVNHPTEEKIEEWINDNKIINKIIELSKLQQKSQRYIKEEDIKRWISDDIEIDKCKVIINKYSEAQKFFKKKDPKKLKDLLKELRDIENTSENRFIQLNNDYEKLIIELNSKKKS